MALKDTLSFDKFFIKTIQAKLDPRHGVGLLLAPAISPFFGAGGPAQPTTGLRSATQKP